MLSCVDLSTTLLLTCCVYIADGVGYCVALSLGVCVGSSSLVLFDMAAEFTTKVRLVRCPKCRQLLPELPDFQVYKCGGCGAILQGKSIYFVFN